MPVAFKTSVTDTNPNATSVAAIGFTRPGTLTDGDFMLASIAVAGGAGTAVTLPMGWTQLLRSDSSTSVSLLVAYKFAQGEPSTIGFGFSASGTHAGVISVYTGVDTFFPFDATATNQNGSSTSQPAPTLQMTAQSSLVVLAFAVASNPTFTAPANYSERAVKVQTGVAVETCDAGASAGALAVPTATISGAQLGSSCSIALRSAVGKTSLAQTDSALKALFPPGADDLYDWNNSTDPSELWKMHQATAGFFKQYGYDVADLIRQEINPLTVVAKLTEWEGALGISQAQASAVNKWTATRQAAILSKLRESGATTLAAVRAVLEPLLGYASPNLGTLQIIECNRAGLTAAHTYANVTGASIGGASNVAQTVYVDDDGGVSAAGAQLIVTLTSTNPEQLSFTLTGPTQNYAAVGSGLASVSWAAGVLPIGSVTSTAFYLNDKVVSPGCWIPGNWTLQINTGAATCTLVSWSLFIEGGGLRDVAGFSGQGTMAFKWLVYADPTKVNNADYAAAQNAITRIRPGYSDGLLVRNPSSLPSTTLYPPFVPRNV